MTAEVESVEARIAGTSKANYLVWRFFTGKASFREVTAYCYKAVRRRRLYVGNDLELSGTWDAVTAFVLMYFRRYVGLTDAELDWCTLCPEFPQSFSAEVLSRVEETALRDGFHWIAHFVVHRVIDQIRRKQAEIRRETSPRVVRRRYVLFSTEDEEKFHDRLDRRLWGTLHAIAGATSKGDETRRIAEARGVSLQQARSDKRKVRKELIELRRQALGSGRRTPGRSHRHRRSD